MSEQRIELSSTRKGLIVVEAVKGARRTTWHLDVSLDQEDFLEALEDILAVFKPPTNLGWNPEEFGYGDQSILGTAPVTILNGASPAGRVRELGQVGIKGDDDYAALKPPIELPAATDTDTFDQYPPGDS